MCSAAESLMVLTKQPEASKLFEKARDVGAGHFIRTSISEKCDFSTKITTQMQLAVTSQSNFVIIFVTNKIGDLRNRISQKYSPRLDF